MLSEKQKVSTIMRLGVELTEVKDVDVLLERILHEARKLVHADAGSIYVKEGDKLKFSYTQNETQQKKLAPGKKLIYSTFSIPINNQTISGYVANTGASLNIPDAYKLKSGLPYSFNRRYDDLSGYRTQSMLTFPLKTNRGDTIGVLQLINAKDAKGKVGPFWKKDEPLIMHFANMAAVAIERAQMTRAMILRTIRMAELRDPKETGSHVNRVAAFAVAIYEAWAGKRGIHHEVIDKNRDILRMAAMLHDVGKVAIADAILKKPGRLDDAEREAMKQHTVMGARLFCDPYSEFDEAAALVALNHHEKWDGTGYPLGLKEHAIPMSARIFAIADVWDALASDRPYNAAWPREKAISYFVEEAGRHFDPRVVNVFLDLVEKGEI